MLGLLCCVSQYQKVQREESAGTEEEVSVLAPLGRKSIQTWVQLLHQATAANNTLSRVVGSITPIRTTIRDSVARAVSAAEELSVQFAFTAALLRAFWTFIKDFPALRDEVSSESVMNAVASIVSLPTPEQISMAISRRFGSPYSHPAVLQETYEEMVVWLHEMLAVWFSGSSTVVYPPIEEAVWRGMARLASYDGISHVARASLANSVVAVLKLPTPDELFGSLEPASQDLFEALISTRDSTMVHAARTLLAANFEGANRSAVSIGYHSQRIKRLRELACLLQSASKPSHADVEELAVVASFVTAVISSPHCMAIASSDAAVVASSLSICLSLAATRRLALRAVKSLAMSTEGRKVLLVESSDVDSVHKSCFAR